MDTPAAEPSSYSMFDTLCGLVFGLAVVVLAVGACLLLGALANAANAARELAASLVGYGGTERARLTHPERAKLTHPRFENGLSGQERQFAFHSDFRLFFDFIDSRKR